MHTKRVLSMMVVASVFVLGISAMVVAQAKRELIVIGHRVHLQSATAEEAGAMGINLIDKFEKMHPNVKVVYQTYPNPKTQEKLYRLGPLSNIEEDLVHVLNTWAVPRVADFLEPLDSYIEKNPLEDFPEDYPEGLLEVSRIKGSIYAVPVRVCYAGIQWINMKIMREIGVEYQPQLTPQEFYDIAKKGTFTRPTGEKVFGYAWRGTVGSLYEPFNRWTTWHGAKLITKDLEVTVNKPEAVKGLTYLQKFYQEGIAPPDVHTFDYAEETKMFMENRLLFYNGNTSYGKTFNDPTKSKIAGYAVMTRKQFPRELQDREPYGIGHTTFWSMGIFKGSQNKDLAWEYIRLLASKEGALSMGLSGTTPARISILGGPEYQQNNPAAQIERLVAPYVEPAWAPFENAEEAIDLIGAYCQEVIYDGASVQEQMNQLARELEPLMP